MFESKALREERAEVIEELQRLASEVQTAQRSMTAEETAKFDELESRQSDLQQQIETAERFAVADSLTVPSDTAERAAKAPSVAIRGSKRTTDANYDAAFRSWSLDAAGQAERVPVSVRSAGESIGLNARATTINVSTRAQSIGVDSLGGHTVNDGTVLGLDERIRNLGTIRRLSYSFGSTTGEPGSIVTFDDDTSGAVTAENTAMGSAQFSFGKVTFGSCKVTSGMASPISYEFLQDSQVPVREMLSKGLARRIAKASETLFLSGSGVNEPEGIVSSGKLADVEIAADPAALDYDTLIDIYHSVPEEYRANASWVVNDLTAAAIRKIKTTAGDPLWQTSLIVGQPDMLLGRPIYTCSGLAPLDGTASATTMLFGDIAETYYIRDVAQTQLQVLTERFADQGAVGYLAWARLDGRVVAPYASVTVTTASA